ncbi:MAG: dTMP kinase [Actinobacteria bacterium]|nr:dTMP kinase [Actinomycetota bacterium]
MFVSFEGLDGSGKSTQSELLRARLEADGQTVLATREPGGTALGEQIRDIVLHGDHVEPWAEALLYAAARAQHVEQVIRPALERGEWVVCDRYVDSSVAYQGVGRRLGLDRVLDINLAAVGGLMPDRTFLLLIDAAQVSSRLRGEHDRLEREDEEFHRRVDAGYRELAERFPDRIVVLDGTRPSEEIAEEAHGALRVST